MRICFLLAYEDNPYEGLVRVFINLAKGLSKRGHEATFILTKCGEKLPRFLLNIGNVEVHEANSFRGIVTKLETINPDFIFADDDFHRLKLLTKIKQKTNFKTGVYALVLFGVHSITEAFDLEYLLLKEKLLFSITRYIPFSLLKRNYIKMLEAHDVIISGSRATANLLHILYGIGSSVVYPPVDTDIFKPKTQKKEDKVLIYLGSHGGDTDGKLLTEIYKTVLDKGQEAVLFGNEKLVGIFRRNVEHVHGVSDEELAEIYSQCKFTICPQKWEQFGYVQVESMACGTPVLAFNCMGPQETVIEGKTGWLANDDKAFIEKLSIISSDCQNIELSALHCRNSILERFSIEKSSDGFIEVEGRGIR